MATRAIRPIRVEGNIAYVPLTQGYEAVIDADDVPLVAGRAWGVQIRRNRHGGVKSIYAVATKTVDGKSITILMHRTVGGFQEGILTDHIDGNGLNNRRANLRPVTHQQNSMNRRPNDGTYSGVKGVTLARGKWQAQIQLDGKNYYLGLYESIDAAAAAYEAASAKLHGQYRRVSHDQ